jgi:hypothetical protein
MAHLRNQARQPLLYRGAHRIFRQYASDIDDAPPRPHRRALQCDHRRRPIHIRKGGGIDRGRQRYTRRQGFGPGQGVITSSVVV